MNKDDIQEYFTFIVNKLQIIVLANENAIIKFDKIKIEDSFALIFETISYMKFICNNNADNKKKLLLELFELYFFGKNNYKSFTKLDTINFRHMINNFFNELLLSQKKERDKIVNKEPKAKLFVDLFSKINAGNFFLNTVVNYFEKKGYDAKCLLKYAMMILEFKYKIYYDLDSMIPINNEDSFELIIDKLNALIKKIIYMKDLNNFQIIYHENNFELIPVNINLLSVFIRNKEVKEFPKYLRNNIIKYNKGKMSEKSQIVENEKDYENKIENYEQNKISETIQKDDNNPNEIILKKLELMESELKQTKNELIKTKNELCQTKNELSQTKNELDKTNTRLTKAEKNLKENKIKIDNCNKELVNTNSILYFNSKKIENYKNEIKKLKKSNKEINQKIENIVHRDIYKSIIDYLLKLLNIKSNEKYNIRISKIINFIDNYMINNKAPGSKYLYNLKIFLKDLSFNILYGNDDSHFNDLDNLDFDYLIKLFPQYKDLFQFFQKLDIIDGIKYIIKKKKAYRNENYFDFNKYEVELEKITKKIGPNFFKIL